MRTVICAALVSFAFANGIAGISLNQSANC